MMTLTLPADDRRVLVRCWWFTLTLLAAVPWIALAWWLGAPPFLMGAAAVITLAATTAYAREGFVWRAYRAWNGRVVVPLASGASRFVMWICFVVVSVAAVTSDRRFQSHAESGSAWTARESLPRAAYPVLFAAAAAPAASGAWARDYVRWALRTGNGWALALVPFLALLRTLPREDEGAAHGNIYTLF